MTNWPLMDSTLTLWTLTILGTWKSYIHILTNTIQYRAHQHSHESFTRLHLSIKVIPCLLHHSPWATIYKPLVKCAKSWEIETPIFSWESLLSLSGSCTDTLYFLSKEEIMGLLLSAADFFSPKRIEPGKPIKATESRTCK